MTGWGWFYLSTVLDDFSRYIIARKLCTTKKAQDVTDTLGMALAAPGSDQPRVVHKPRLLSDNGSSYVSADLADWLEAQDMGHVRGGVQYPICRRPRQCGKLGIERILLDAPDIFVARGLPLSACSAVIAPRSTKSRRGRDGDARPPRRSVAKRRRPWCRYRRVGAGGSGGDNGMRGAIFARQKRDEGRGLTSWAV